VALPLAAPLDSQRSAARAERDRNTGISPIIPDDLPTERRGRRQRVAWVHHVL